MECSAIGLIEVEGYSVALTVLNSIEKAVSIQVLAIDCNNPKNEKKAEIPMTVQLILSGRIDEIEEALLVGRYEALNYLSSAVVSTTLISRQAEGLLPLITDGKVVPQYQRKEFSLELLKKVQAIGLIEVQHYTNALLVMNDLLQMFSITYEHHEVNLGGRLVTLIFSGSIAQVMNACNYILENKHRYDEKVLTSIPINYPTEEMLRYILSKKTK